MPGMFSHVAPVWQMACRARDRALAAQGQGPREDALVAIILAVVTTEAFINELAEYISIVKEAGLPVGVPASLVAFSAAHREAESGHGSTQLKYTLAAALIDGRPFDRGANPFQDFQTLVRLRNDIMHLKPKDQFDPAKSMISEPPKYVAALQARGLALSEAGVSYSWFDVVQTKEMAVWACETARSIVLDVLRRLPSGSLDRGTGTFAMFSYLLQRMADGEPTAPSAKS